MEDALSCKVEGYVSTISAFQGDFLGRLRQFAATDSDYANVVQAACDDHSRRYWIDGSLLYTHGARVFVPRGGGLWQLLLRESHDPQWTGHPGVECMMALLSRSYY